MQTIELDNEAETSNYHLTFVNVQAQMQVQLGALVQFHR